jgi:hypothetical protein
VPERSVLEDIGLRAEATTIYTDVLPDSALLVFIVLLLRLRQSYERYGASKRKRTSKVTAIGCFDVLWLWAYEQSKLADFISAITFFTIGCSGVSAVHSGYFLIGVVVCIIGSMPAVLWFTAFLFIVAHTLAIYALQLQYIIFNSTGFTCDAGVPDPAVDSRWECCALWAGVTFRRAIVDCARFP